jgi:DNA-binding MarR family transcriptional regulator
MDQDQHKLVMDINRAIIRLRMAYERWCRDRGITYVQMLVLYTIRDEPRCTQKFISDHYLMPKQTVHNTVLRMVKEGLVELAEGEGREKVIVLTPKGRAWAGELTETLNSIETEAVEAAGQGRLADLVRDFMIYDDCLEEAFRRCRHGQCK